MPKIKDLKTKLLFTAGYFTDCALFYALKITCLFKPLLGITCPGCGMTRATISALRFDFSAAFSHHYMFWAMPILYLYFLFDGRLLGKKADRAFLIIITTGFLINWLLNLL